MANLGKLAIAMLGVLAYQNRDKIGDLIRRAGERDPNNPQGGIVDQLSKGVSGTALGDILDRFRNVGAGAKVDSWVGAGPNEPIEPPDVETAIDEETLNCSFNADWPFAGGTHRQDHAGSPRGCQQDDAKRRTADG